MSVSQQRLKTLIEHAPSSSEHLFQLLVEGLDWPAPADLTMADVELDWDPAELHLDPAKIATLRSIKQIPPLKTGQKFGVFVLDFEGGRLPIGAIRRLVDRLVRKKRSRTSPGTHALWSLEDLLFFCFSSEGTNALHVVGFREQHGKRILRVMSWSRDMTPRRLDLLLHKGIPDLHWATNGPAIALDPEGFHGGFRGYRQGIKSAAALSARMADVAQDVRDEVLSMYEVETDEGPIRALYAEIRDHLLGSLTPKRFADVYAQTMVYGLLSARIAHPEQFSADEPITALSFENPFLDAIYGRFRAQSDDVLDVDELGLRELAEELASTDVDELLADFGAKQRKDDPVAFFYEDFLTRYDPQQRRDLGAFYTPTPVVRFMVRTVDRVLRDSFGMPLGVADGTTWAELARVQRGVTVPDGVDPYEPVASMVDPANGTGTFFVEWLRLVRATAGDEAVESALSRMDALEISLASYAVAHLKVSLELPPEVRSRVRLPIYLGDSLGIRHEGTLAGTTDPVSAEGVLADGIKYDRLHNIVVGNPPYDRVESMGTSGFLARLRPGGKSLFDDILDPAREHTSFAHVASLYNRYVYFWRWSLWKAFEQIDGPAVVSLITAASWLTGPGFLGLRQLVRELADEIWVVDLGGDNKGARKEESVFDIETPVSIVTIFRRGSSDRSVPAVVSYTRIRGSRSEKLSALETLAPHPAASGWRRGPDGWHKPLAPPTGDFAWEAYPRLTDLLPWQQPGCKFGRTWPIAPDVDTLRRRWQRFLSTNDATDRALCFYTGSSGRNIHTSVTGMGRLVDLPVNSPPESIQPYAYRSFDRQWAFADPRLAKTESPSLWSSISRHQVFLVSKTTFALGRGPGATVTTGVPDLHHFRGSFGGKDVLPLYRDATGAPNADPALLWGITAAHRQAVLHSPEVTAEGLFAYIYAVLAGCDYTERFAIALETPGPRIPLTADPELFAGMVQLGENLLWLHTFGERFRSSGQEDIPHSQGIAWTSQVKRMPTDLKDVHHDAEREELHVADGVLTGVRTDVWQFEVSGMRVIRKWLGYRMAKAGGRAASSTSPLDAIRPTRWKTEWSVELRDLVEVLTRTVDALPKGADLLERICAGPLLVADDLPAVPPELRDPPSGSRGRRQATLTDDE